jgi:hypothetical protein
LDERAAQNGPGRVYKIIYLTYANTPGFEWCQMARPNAEPLEVSLTGRRELGGVVRCSLLA